MYFFFIFVVTSFSIAEMALGADVVYVVKSHTKSFVREIHSIEFGAVAEWCAVLRDSDGTEKFREQIKYFQSGNMSGTSASSVYSDLFKYDDFSSDWVIIYNGESFQTFQFEIETEEWKEWYYPWTATIPSRNVSPINQVFSWLDREIFSPHVWSSITTDANIDDVFKQAKYIGKRMLNGIECAVLEFHRTHPDRPDRKFMYEVWFSLKHDYFPTRIVFSVDDWTTIDTEVKSIRKVNLDNGTRLFIPVEIVSVNTFPRTYYSSSVDTTIMDTNTLRINHKIDDSLFMQPTAIAERMLHDGQLDGEDILLKSDTSTLERQCSSRYKVVVIFIVSIVFIGLFVYYLFLRRR